MFCYSLMVFQLLIVPYILCTAISKNANQFLLVCSKGVFIQTLIYPCPYNILRDINKDISTFSIIKSENCPLLICVGSAECTAQRSDALRLESWMQKPHLSATPQPTSTKLCQHFTTRSVRFALKLTYPPPSPDPCGGGARPRFTRVPTQAV